MPEFDVETFVARLDRMGLKLTSIPLADGKLRVNRWRMLNAGEHTQQIHDLWATQIGNNQERIDLLAAHLAKAAPQVTANGISPNRARSASQSMTASNASTVPDPHRATAAQMGAALQKPAGIQTATASQRVATALPTSDGLRKAK